MKTSIKVQASEPRPGVVSGVAHVPRDVPQEEVQIERLQAVTFEKGKKYLVIVKLIDTGADAMELGRLTHDAVAQVFAEQFPEYSIEVMVTVGGVDVSVIEAPRS